jgi:hypothetical protein
VLSKQTYSFKVFLGAILYFSLMFTYSPKLTAAEQKQKLQLDLYGHKLQLAYDGANLQINYPIGSAQIEKQLKLVQQTKLGSLIEQMDDYSDEFGMDDIAYMLFSRKLSNAIYSDPNTAKIFQYQLLKEKGYNVLLTLNSEMVVLYGFLDFKILNGTEIFYDGLEYTDLSFEYNLEPCELQFIERNSTGRAIAINENRPPFFNATKGKYDLHAEYEGMVYFFEGTLNQSLAEYYHDLPDIEFGQIYLNYQLSSPTYEHLVGDLKRAISGMYPNKQIDFLLDFTQTAFPYKLDKNVIGKEKFAFPEEVLANNYGDCEDKSVLFAYLVKEVLQLPSVAMVYVSQNHLNVAVAINHPSFNFVYNNQKYLICEPSGKGFEPGDNVYDLKKASIVKW